jgi:NAD(P)-dependent dehydrogenase (short-subunit alcohol dehydrogenase family)
MSAAPTTDPEREPATLLQSPPALRLDGQVAWVTGASRGVGRAVAYALAGAGARVAIMARTGDALRDVADTLRAAGHEVEMVVGSVTDADDVAAAAESVHRRWGRLDVLVNNAGISPSFVLAERVDLEDFAEVQAVNVRGPILCTQRALPFLAADGGGAVVNVSSVHGTVAHERTLSYAASKGALEMVTRTFAVEWAGRGVRVNAVAPGYLETDMTEGLRDSERWRAHLLARIPMGRFGRPDEVVGAILFLASAAARYITGTTLFVDGGWTAQ